jgi:hypothetical protein
VRRRHEQERQQLGQIARVLLAQTGYGNARSAEMALRRQFKRHGWPLHTAARRAPPGARSWAGEPLTVGRSGPSRKRPARSTGLTPPETSRERQRAGRRVD